MSEHSYPKPATQSDISFLNGAAQISSDATHKTNQVELWNALISCFQPQSLAYFISQTKRFQQKLLLQGLTSIQTNISQLESAMIDKGSA